MSWTTEDIAGVLQRFWGYTELRPLQEQAIRAELERRDSLVVMPTGGGKSLCYQIPPEVATRTDIVVSPLIALMKDQVDGLRECGYAACALYSGMEWPQVREAESGIADGRFRLVFVAPERLLTPRFLQLVKRLPAPAFAIDEAHCISHWGHDFRPEYRQLAELKTLFPGASVHAYTATATTRVREDIIEQLRLEKPEVIVGTFDRPNLVYRIVPRVDAHAQALEILRRHEGEAAIVYCLSRKDSESMAAHLRMRGMRAACYHAGMDADERRRTQDAFAAEEIDVVAATVAFGMGIDRSDVRVVIHAAMPKSIEHYQQETGRAGRDGLEAECVLLYSAADAIRWESLLDRSAAEAGADPQSMSASLQLLDHMRRFCSGVRCRHQALSEYFGQKFAATDCGACDACLSEIEGIADSTVTAQKILSCVARTGQRFGAEHIVDVLLGADTERVRRWNHNQVSTYGLMQDTDRKSLTNLLYQLVDSGLLDRTEDERPVLKLNDGSWEVMRGQREVTLRQPKVKFRKTRVDQTSWEGVDRALYDRLRTLRHQIAAERRVPAYLVFSDATLRDMARLQPRNLGAMRRIRGIGERKLADLGAQFLALITSFSASTTSPMAHNGANVSVPEAAPAPGTKKAKSAAFEMFARNAPVNEVAASVGRSPTTVWSYLGDVLAQNPAHPLDAWVKPQIVQAIAEAAAGLDPRYLKPIHERLGGAVPYEYIRLTLVRIHSSSKS
jgi:ATP-dependent DNA helicase RecQ